MERTGAGFRIRRSKTAAVLMLAVSALTLAACLEGLFNERIYNDLLAAGKTTKLLVFGSKAQDMTFIPFAVILAVLSLRFIKKPNEKVFVVMLGLTGNFFYGYALYAMEGSYTSIYLIYLAIFSLSIYSLIFGTLSFSADQEKNMELPKRVRVFTGVFLYCVVLILSAAWLVRISADIAKHVPQDTYAVFVLDLGIVFPAIAITATRLVRNMRFGIILTGIILVKVFTICLSWGFSEWYGRLTGVLEGNFELLAIPAVLTFTSGIFFLVYLVKAKHRA